MKPITFNEANKTLTPPPDDVGRAYEGVKDIQDLDVWTDDSQCVSLWRPSLRERISVFLFGKVWVSILSGSTQPPIYIHGHKNYFQEKD